MPLSPSSWISRASSPERTRSRVMKSYHGLCPRRLSATSGLAVADGLSLMHRSEVRSAFTAAAAAAGVKPNSANRRSAGAEAPKLRMAMMVPRSPTQRSQPKGLAASIATRAEMAGGSTCVPILARLRGEQLPRWQRHDAGRHPVTIELVPAALMATPTSEPVAIRMARGADTGSYATYAPRPTSAAVASRGSTGTFCRVSTMAVGPVAPLERDLPGGHRLVGVGRPECHEARNGPQHRQLVDRLVRRPVLAHADRVVRADVDHRKAHQCREADRRLHVVEEDEEGAAEGPDAAVRGEAVHARTHGVLANAPVHHASRDTWAECAADLLTDAGAARQVG